MALIFFFWGVRGFRNYDQGSWEVVGGGWRKDRSGYLLCVGAKLMRKFPKEIYTIDTIPIIIIMKFVGASFMEFCTVAETHIAICLPMMGGGSVSLVR